MCLLVTRLLWTCNFVSFWTQFNSHTQVFIRERENKMGTSPVFTHINLRRTWWRCWNVDNATLHAGFCLRVGEHERLAATAEFRRNATIPRMLLESFDCRCRSNRPCAAKVQNNVCWMVGKIQWTCHHPCSMSHCAEPPSIWSPGFVSPSTGTPNCQIPRRGLPCPSSSGVSEADNPD